MKKLIFILFVFLVFQASATIYYVDSSITDTNVGSAAPDFTTYNPTTFSTSTGSASVFKSIADIDAKINYAAGDQILFKKGDTWRDQLDISSSGASGNPIIFGSYGTGSNPRILGSTLETSWTNVSGNIWVSTGTYIDPNVMPVGSYGADIFFLETNNTMNWGRIKKVNTAACVAEYDWTWATNHIYIYSPTDPNARYSGVEIPQRMLGIRLHSKQYVTIDGLEIAYSGFYGIAESGSEASVSELTVKNCHIHHIGRKEYGMGIESFYSNALFQNNIIHDSGRRNISLNLYEDNAQVHDVIVEGNTLYNSFHTSGVDINNIAGSSLTNVTIRRNLIYNDISMDIDNVEIFGSAFIFCAREGTGDIGNINVYDNIFKGVTSIGISVGNVSGPSSMYVYNNTFYGVSTHITGTNSGFIFTESGSNVEIKNNIFYNDVDINLNPNLFVIATLPGSGTVMLDNNLYYNTSATRLMSWLGTVYTVSQWATYKSVSGQDAHSILGDNPDFISSSDYNLQSSSPAINAGVDVGLTTDFLGHIYVGLPDMGAYEYGGTTPIIIKRGISSGGGKMWGIGGISYGN